MRDVHSATSACSGEAAACSVSRRAWASGAGTELPAELRQRPTPRATERDGGGVPPAAEAMCAAAWWSGMVVKATLATAAATSPSKGQ